MHVVYTRDVLIYLGTRYNRAKKALISPVKISDAGTISRGLICRTAMSKED
jgi:hypothetical protein